MAAGVSVLLVYLGIAVAAMIEGEIAYVAAATLVARGQLNPVWVVVAGTIGAGAGDQAYFYLFRKRLNRFVAHYPSLQRRAAPLVDKVRRHDTAMVLLIRFAPGLRVALAAACAYADVLPLKFSILNTVTALVWAVLLLALVAWAGPTYLAAFGLAGWKGALLMGAVVIVLFRVVGRFQTRRLEDRS